jgi:hypothetical protein
VKEAEYQSVPTIEVQVTAVASKAPSLKTNDVTGAELE